MCLCYYLFISVSLIPTEIWKYIFVIFCLCLDQLVRIEDLQRELTEKRLSIIGLEERLETVEAEKKALSEDTEKKNDCMAELQKIILEKQSCIDRLEHAVSESEAKNIEEVRSGLKEVLDQKLIVEEHAKKILNAVFRLVKVQLQPHTNYNATKVLSMLGDTIKVSSFQFLILIIVKFLFFSFLLCFSTDID